MGNEVSTSGDVYSFGILLLELFTGKRPTNEMFKGDLSLHCFVKEALGDQITTILDHAVLQDIESQEEDCNLKLEAINCMLEIALSCSNYVPQQRLDMTYVATKLSSIRKNFIGACSQQRRQSNQVCFQIIIIIHHLSLYNVFFITW